MLRQPIEEIEAVHVYRELTPEEQERYLAARKHVEEHPDEYLAEGQASRMQHEALQAAVKMLRKERQARGVSLGELATRLGVEEDRLARIEEERWPYPTLDDLAEIANALDVRLSLSITTSLSGVEAA